MSKVAILTDSNSGITQAQSKEMGVTVIPMPFLLMVSNILKISILHRKSFTKLQEDADISTSQPSSRGTSGIF